MQWIRCLVVGGLVGWATTVPTTAMAQSSPVVVELYTAQGCSACPPADEFMTRLADRDDIIALALHVDYWDYLGWADSFAQPKFSDRQRNYAKANGERMVYTPQLIVDGVERVEGVRPMLLADLVRAHKDRPRRVRLTLDRADGRLTIGIAAEPPLDREAVVQLVRYLPRAQVAIERGENEGRSLTYHNIVTLWDTLTRWDGQGPLTLTAEVPGADPVVVIVQSAGHGPVLAAGRLR